MHESTKRRQPIASRWETEEGKAEGKAEGRTQAILMVLHERGIAVPDPLRERILACTDLGTLERWLKLALHCTSVDELVQTEPQP